MMCTTKFATTGLALLSLAAASMPLHAAEKAVLQAHVAPSEQVSFDVFIPVQHRAELDQDLENRHNPSHGSFHQWLTPAQTVQRYSATPAQIAAIQNQLAGFGLKSTVVNGFHLRVSGPSGNVEQALGTSLQHGIYSTGAKIVAAVQPINPPSALVAVNASVLGLESSIHMRTHAHVAAAPDNRYSYRGAYWYDDLKQAYSFPSYQTYTGAGTTIAILVDGAYMPADMVKYFTHELTPTASQPNPAPFAFPHFSEINVGVGAPVNGDSFETELDMQQTGGMAPGASIIHYNIPSLSDQDIVDGLTQIITDNKADIVNMSFGGFEVGYTKGDNGGTDYTYILKLEDDLMALGNLQGITFVASSGDAGALSAPPVVCFNTPAPPNCGAMRASAEFPASSPHVTGVGGTNLVTSYDGATKNSAYVGEEAYADPLTKDIFYGTTASGAYWGSGGGNSIIFAKPTFQILANTGSSKYRTVPDLAGHMGGCPGGVAGPCNPSDSADYEVFNNLYYGVIGTSASSPDFAGLLALTEQSFGGRLGNINSFIYSMALSQALGSTSPAFNQGIPGFNGLYFTKGTGYDRVLGNGTVNGINFMLAPGTATAGVPQTPSNP